MEDFYRENILDHYRNPRNKGALEHATHVHEEQNPLCGDEIRMYLYVNDEDVIERVSFEGQGCAISQASASMLTEMVEGKSLEEAKQISKDDILEALGIEIGPVRLKCALLSLKVLKASVYGIPEWREDEEEEEDW
jgi:nitrogen fixation NifU-like protein